MTDNARIGSALGFAIHALRTNGGAPCDLSAASDAEAELRVLLDDRASLDAMTTLLARARNERDAVAAELATAQADLARAREGIAFIREELISDPDSPCPDHAHSVAMTWDDDGTPCEECETWARIWDLAGDACGEMEWGNRDE